jgi:phosphoglycerate dehydrogenase-like enzyme
MHTVITCLPLHPSGQALLEARPDVTVRHLPAPSPEALRQAIGEATAVMVGLEPVDEALLAAAGKLSIVSRFGVATTWSISRPARGAASPSASPTAATISRSPNTR